MSNAKDKRDDIVVQKDANNLPVIVSGFDPFFVAFYDYSIHRSFNTDNWYWDFGDYVYYGFSECEREISGEPFTRYHCVTGAQDRDYAHTTIFNMFELSGDDTVVAAMGKVDEIYNRYESFVVGSQLGNKRGLMIPLKTTESTYPSTKTWHKHYTGIWFRASIDEPHQVAPTEKTVTTEPNCLYGLECNSMKDGRHLGCPTTNVEREIGTYANPVRISTVHTVRDSCGGGAGRSTCSSNVGNDMENTVYHVYKGAGVYPVSMKMYLMWKNTNNQVVETKGRKLISPTGSDIDESDESKIPNVYAQDALVVVAPVCPCISGVEVTKDKYSIGITADDFSCASAGCFGDEYWDRVIGILGGFTTRDKDIPDKDRYITTGYGPFVHITVSGNVQPRSMPVTAFEWRWDDWFIDKDCVSDYYWMGDVVGGWSTNWATLYPNTYEPMHDSIKTCHVYSGVRTFFGNHTYTMPGCYRISYRPFVDYGRLPPILWDFIDKPDCEPRINMGEKVMVREVKPKFADARNPIHVDKTKIDENTIDVRVNVFERLIPGSYPIGRIDWDFHDGTDIASIYRYDYMRPVSDNTYQKYFDDKFEPNITSGEAMSDLKVAHGTSLVPYRCYDYNYFVGNGVGSDSTATEYKETCPETWKMYHRYTKHEIDDGTRTISVTAYAEDTMSPCSGEVVIDLFPVYADIDDGEGIARVVDTRLHDDTTLIVFEGEKTKQLYTTKL